MPNLRKKTSKLSKRFIRLITMLLGVILAMILTTSIIIFLFQFNSNTNSQVKLSVNSTSVAINNWLDGLRIPFETLGNDKQFVQGVKDLNNMDSIIRGSIENKEASESVLYVQSKLDSLYSYGNGAILSAYIGTTNNQIQQAPYSKLDSNFKCTEEEWYTDILKANGYKISKPYTEDISKTSYIKIGYPIKENGKVIGVIGIDVSLSSIFKQIESFNFSEQGFLSLLVKEDGKYKSIYNSQENLNKFTFNKFLVDTIEGEKVDYQIKGISKLISNIRTKRELSDSNDKLKLVKIKINNKNYRAVVVKDDFLNLYYMAGINSYELTKDILTIYFALALVLMIFGGLLIFVIGKNFNTIASYIESISSIVNNLKNKNLNLKVEGDGLNCKDEVGDLSNDINTMIDSLTEMIQDISQISYTLGDSSNELSILASTAVGSADDISTSIQSITNASTEQTTHSQLCTSLSNELSNKLDDAASSSQEMKSLAEEVITTNKKGLDAVTKLQSSTLDTNNATSNIETTILNLEQKTETINSIVETISNISEQTNLLALNASIEAARAGDAGRGFSVVADEVKKLAEQSHVAANKIKYIIEDVKLDVHEAVLNAKDVKEIVSIQNNSVSDVNNSFDEISSSIEKISLVIAEV
ncbi:MAG: hypothetical protein IJH34_11905, partial [Romboutsia sp.]|nr:hypothetical protein [Romboutsia sp.]